MQFSNFAGSGRTSNKRVLVSVALAAGLALGAAAGPALAAGTLDVTFSDNAASTIYADPGDVFNVAGLGGNLTLTSGVVSTVDVLSVTESLGCCWDDGTYSTTVNHTLTLNGVGNGFSQFWQVFDWLSPGTDLAGAGPVVFDLPTGTVTVTMNGGEGFHNYTADLLYSEKGAVPEPATWALMIGGFGLAGAVVRRRRMALAA